MTGAWGFLGRPLIERLAAEGCQVAALDRHPGDGHFPAAVTPIVADLGDPGAVEAALAGVEVLYHLACSTVPATSAADPVGDVAENVVGAVRLFEAAAASGVEKIVYPSSGGTVYGVARQSPIDESHPTEPIGAHGAMKLAVERYLVALSRQRGYVATILRLANPYGPGQWRRRTQGVLGAMLRAAATGEEVTLWGDGSLVRDYFAREDAVEALVAARLGGDDQVMNVGSGQGHSILQLLEIVERVVGRPVPRRWQRDRGFDVPVNVLDPRRAREVLGWRVRIPLEEGLRRMWAAYPAAAAAPDPGEGLAEKDPIAARFGR